jgi:thiol-disulfide isomerase/thioredoxin
MKILRLFAVALCGVLLLAACTGKDAVSTGSANNFRFVSGTSVGKTIGLADRKAVKDFSGDLLNGGTFNLSQDAGNVVVINFWATWCSPCVVETPQFDSVYRAYKSKGVSFVGIDTKETSPSRSASKAFVKDNQISYPIVWDEQAQTALSLGKIPSLSLPFTVLLDKHQRVAAVYLHSLTPDDLEPVLNSLIAES